MATGQSLFNRLKRLFSLPILNASAVMESATTTKVGGRGDNTTTRNISFLIYLISCKLFPYLKDFSYICNEVAHIYDNST